MKIHSGAELYRLAQGAPAHKAQDIPSPKADDSGPVDSLERTSDSKSLLYKWKRISDRASGKAPSAANVINREPGPTRSLKAFPGFIYRPSSTPESATEQSQILMSGRLPSMTSTRSSRSGWCPRSPTTIGMGHPRASLGPQRHQLHELCAMNCKIPPTSARCRSTIGQP